MSKLKVITLATYDKNYGTDKSAALFLINRSDGRLTMNVLNDQNRPDTIIIPQSFAPIDVTAIVPRVNLLQNSTFKRFINIKYLAVVDNKDVMALLRSDKDLAAEYQRVNTGGAEIEEEIELAGLTGTSGPSKLADNQAKVSNNFLDGIVMECQSIEAGDQAKRSQNIAGLVTSFKQKAMSFSVADLREFINEVPSTELRNLALEQIEELETTPDL
jgi:hypothetical protein